MRTSAVLLIALPMLAGCAQMLPGASPTPRKVQEDTSGTFDGRTYALSQEELGLDCRRLAGRMQVRILQIRDADERPVGTMLSQGAQIVARPLMGGSTYGVDPAGSLARDRAMLQAYNAQLKAKNCPTFDLEQELKPRDVQHTPRPQQKS